MVELRILGPPQLLASGGQPVETLSRQPKRTALLAYLAAALPRGFHRRDKLLSLFWPELDGRHARNALSQALHVLRQALGESVILTYGDGEVGLNRDLVRCDAVEFEAALDAARPAEALDLYRGDLLDGFFISGAPDFERWLEGERARLRQRASEGAWALAEARAAAGDVLEAERWAGRAAYLLPADEAVVRRLMSFLHGLGDRAAAIRAYETFARTLAREYELEPSAETQGLAAAIRREEQSVPAGAPPSVVRTPSDASPVAVGSLGPLAEAAPTPGSRVRTGGLGTRLAIGAGALLLAGSVAVLSYRNPTRLDPDLLAVAPFDLLDEGAELELWREGLVDVLSRNLDGAGPFRTVTPSLALRGWKGRADRASARELADRTGAGLVLFGQLLRAGPDSVRLTAAVLEAREDRTIAEVDRRERSDRIDRLVDTVTVDVIRALTHTTPQIHVRLSSVGTKSLPALKAFLQGERYLRQFALDSAIASYDRAIALDTTFALALRSMGLARAWNLQGAEPYWARAGAHSRGLAPRDSLLIASDSQNLAGLDFPFVRRKFALLNEAVDRYPEDPEIWFELGDARFHTGFVVWNTWEHARAAFDQAIALDSMFAIAYIHPVEIALHDNDPEAALRYVRGYLAIPSVIPQGAGMRLLEMLLDRRTTTPQDLERELEAASWLVLRRLALAVRAWPDSNETQILVARHLLETTRASVAGTGGNTSYALRQYVSLLANALVFRGHLREARGVVGQRFAMPAFMELAHLGAIPPDTVEMVVRRGLEDPEEGTHVVAPWFREGPCYRTMDAGLWWASRGDTASLQWLVSREDSAFQAIEPNALGQYEGPAPRFVHAALALARADSAAALRGFLYTPRDSLCPDAQQRREMGFRLAAALGPPDHAIWAFDRLHERRVPVLLERARLAERTGDRKTAIKYYRFVVQAWLHADPELQPVVAEARTALQRLDRVEGP